jgi:hypothetical protein
LATALRENQPKNWLRIRRRMTWRSEQGPAMAKSRTGRAASSSRRKDRETKEADTQILSGAQDIERNPKSTKQIQATRRQDEEMFPATVHETDTNTKVTNLTRNKSTTVVDEACNWKTHAKNLRSGVTTNSTHHEQKKNPTDKNPRNFRS